MFLHGTFSAVQPVHLHRPTRAARARKSANMVSANMVSVLPILKDREPAVADVAELPAAVARHHEDDQRDVLNTITYY